MGNADTSNRVLIELSKRSEGLRLDQCLKQLAPSFSRAFWIAAVKRGAVSREEGAPIRPAARVRAGETLEIDLGALDFPALLLDPAELGEPVHLGEHFAVFAKPAGLLTHPAGRIVLRSVTELAARKLARPVHTCHRLDKYTSGLLLLALDPTSAARAGELFVAGRVEKTYLALTRFPPADDRFVIDQPLAQTGEEHVKLKQLPSPDGKPARTRFRVLERFDEGALLACYPETGRQHQIRAHLLAAGSPIVGDLLYGPEEDHAYFDEMDERKHAAPDGRWHGLHCHRMRLPGLGPEGEALELEAPPEGAFAEVLAAWG